MDNRPAQIKYKYKYSLAQSYQIWTSV